MPQNESIVKVSQPSIFRCELLVLGILPGTPRNATFPQEILDATKTILKVIEVISFMGIGCYLEGHPSWVSS